MQSQSSIHPPSDYQNKLHEVIKKDLKELQQIENTESFKAIIVLCGSILEGILIYRLLYKKPLAKNASSAKKSSIKRWTLKTLIEVSKEIGLDRPIINTMCDELRDYRNIIHPAKFLKSDIQNLESVKNECLSLIENLYNNLRIDDTYREEAFIRESQT